MKIYLKGNYILTSDSRSYTLSKFTNSTDDEGNPIERIGKQTYHGRISGALKSYREQYTRGSECKTVDEILKAVIESNDEISKVLGDLD